MPQVPPILPALRTVLGGPFNSACRVADASYLKRRVKLCGSSRLFRRAFIAWFRLHTPYFASAANARIAIGQGWLLILPNSHNFSITSR